MKPDIDIFGPITGTLAEATRQRLNSFVRGVSYGRVLASRNGDFTKMPPLNEATCGPVMNKFVEGVQSGYLFGLSDQQVPK
jgi:hypothetical protein